MKRDDLLLILGIFAFTLLVGGGAAVVYTMTRGLRNNNPGNLRAGIAWQGITGQDSGGYAVFDTPQDGIRALALNLYNYFRLHGLNTVASIVTRWAPPSENDTASYIAHVAAQLGVASNEVLNVPARLADLTRAIILHENGVQPYDSATITAGVQAALSS